jgi:hypothetical protein
LKKLTILFLAAVLVYNAVGFVVSFQVVRHEWRLSVCEQLLKVVDKNNCAVFKLSENDAQSSKDELTIGGKFYDVINREIQGDSVVIHCFSDEKETQLFSQFYDDIQQMTTQNTDFQGKTQLLLSSLIKDFLFENTHSIKRDPSVYWAFRGVFYDPNVFFPTCFLETNTPPPNAQLRANALA